MPRGQAIGVPGANSSGIFNRGSIELEEEVEGLQKNITELETKLKALETKLTEVETKLAKGIEFSWGIMGAAGEILGSSGDFTVAKIAEGQFEIKWNTAKASKNYSAVASPLDPPEESFAWISPIEAAKFTVALHTLKGGFVNTGFAFIATIGNKL